MFAGAWTPLSNPASAILTQSKRFPLIWDALRTSVAGVAQPAAGDPRSTPGAMAHVIGLDRPPAFGRVGEGVGMRDLIDHKEMQRIGAARDGGQARGWRNAAFILSRWRVATRTYSRASIYTLDERAVGAYGRLARVPLIDSRAADAAVLVTDRGSSRILHETLISADSSIRSTA